MSQLIALRSHTIRGIKTNFSSWYKSDLSCPFKCVNSQDTQEHLLLCKPLLDDLTQEKRDAALLVNYNDIYGNIYQQIDAVKVFSELLETREELLHKAKSISGLSLHWSLLLQGASVDFLVLCLSEIHHQSQNFSLKILITKF